MQNSKWGITHNDDDKCYVVLFVSRSKDNKDIPYFTERRTSFITQFTQDCPFLQQKFQNFVNAGQPNELSRMYYSVNARSMSVVRKQIIHYLIDDDTFNLCAIQAKIAGFAAQKEAAIEKKWMIDFDSKDHERLSEFCRYLNTKDEYPLVTD